MQDLPGKESDVMPLRERRRRQTEREIQAVTLKLANTHGFAQVTSEMIAAAAGISQRTFFNYFPNKEAAVIGRPGEIAPEILARFTGSDGALPDDLRQLIRDHCLEAAPAKELIRAIVMLIDKEPHLRSAFIDSLEVQALQLADALQTRLGPDCRLLAEMLADTIIRGIGMTFYFWAYRPDVGFEAALDEMLCRLDEVGRILCDHRQDRDALSGGA